MPTLHRFALATCALGMALLLGCGGGEADGLARVKAALAGKDSKTATVAVKSFLQKHPKSAEGRFLLGQQLMRNGEFAAAVPELQRALEAGHPLPEVIPAMARAMVRTGEFGKLLAMFRDERLAQPEAMASLGASLAMAMAVQGDTTGAMALVDNVLVAAPTSAPARLMKARLKAVADQVPEGMRILDTLLAEQPGDAEAWVTKGDFMLRQPGGQQAAADAFAKALAINPNDAQALGAMVSVQLALGHADAARQAVAQLKQAAPGRFDTVRSEGSVAYATGDHARAREIFQALLKSAPTNVQVLLLAGENELRLGAAAQAEALLAKASALVPRDALPRRLLAEAQLRLGQPARALVTLAPLTDAINTPADVLALAAQARLANGETRAADALFDRLARLKPADPRLRTVMATAGLGKSNDGQAIAQLRDIAAADATGTSADIALIGAQLQRGRFDDSLAAADALVRKRPNEPLGHQLRGQVLAQKGDVPAARQAFALALQIDPNHAQSILALAALDMRDNLPDAAQQRLTDLLKRQPKNAAAMLALAELAARQVGGRGAALQRLEAATKAMPGDVDVRIALIAHHVDSNQVDAALHAALAASVALPENIDVLLWLGRCQLRAAQPSQALATYGKVIQLQPKSPLGHLGQADVHLAGGAVVLAQRSIDSALALAPGLPQAQAQAVAVALRRNQFDAALAVTRDMQARGPADARGWLLEAEVETRRARWDAAAAALRKALDLPGGGAAAIRLHQALQQAGKSGDADLLARRWLAAHARDTGFLFHLGAAAQARGDTTQAEQRYRDVLAVDPEHAAALNNLAMLLLQQKKPGALDLAARAVRHAPDQPPLLDTLALAQAADGQAARAVETQLRAVALAPDEPALTLNLARHLVGAGDKAKAKAHLDALARLGSSFPQQAEADSLRAGLGPLLPGR